MAKRKPITVFKESAPTTWHTILSRSSEDSISISEEVNKIIELTEDMCGFWSTSRGWAPEEAADILTSARLDWHLSLTKHLKKCVRKPSDELHDAHLILAWTTLGALVEGAMKLFLSIYFEDYKKSMAKTKHKRIKPDDLMFDKLRLFFKGEVWDVSVDRVDWNEWVEKKIQYRRNAIHAYKDRDIGNMDDFRSEVRIYLLFLSDIDSRVPYP